MPGFRTTCNYCDKNLLSRDLGRHIYNHHLTDLFSSTENKTHLRASKTSICSIRYGTDNLYWCFGCMTCYSKRVMAQRHFDDHKCLEKHTATVNSLLESHGSKETVNPTPQSSCDDITKKRLEDLVIGLYNRLHEYHACLAVHKDKIQFTEKDDDWFNITPELLDDKFVFESPLLNKLSPFIDFDEDKLRERTNRSQRITEIYEYARKYKDALEAPTELRTEHTPEESIPPPIQETPVDPPEESIPPPIQETPVIEEPPVPRVSKRQPRKTVIPIPKLQEETPPPPPPVPVKIPQLIQSQPTYIPQKVQPQSIPIIKNTKQEKQVKSSLTIPSDLEKELSRMTPQQRQIFLQIMTQKDIDNLTQRY